MILRHRERKGRRNWRLLIVTAAITKVLLAAGSAEERRVLSAVTPDTLAKGEKVKVRWNYDDGNGGERSNLFVCYYFLKHFYSVWKANYSDLKKKRSETDSCALEYRYRSDR